MWSVRTRQNALHVHEDNEGTARYGSGSGPPTRSQGSRELVRMLRAGLRQRQFLRTTHENKEIEREKGWTHLADTGG